MKIFHTADWHLGKIIHGISMIEDQIYILNQFIDRVIEHKPDVIIVAGDLYDRALPPPEAVQLLNKTIDTIVLQLQTPMVVIAGNHDSPSRIQFGSRLMQHKGLYIKGEFTGVEKPIIGHDEFGEVHIHPIPYVEPTIVKQIYKDPSIRTFNDAFQKITTEIWQAANKNARHVVVSHSFVTPTGEERPNTSDSERRLAVGGVEFIDASHFEPFDYVALGHLHRSHAVKEKFIRYSGSPLKYSISEEHHEKGFYEINLDESGVDYIEKHILTPKRDLRTIEGEMDDILQMDPSDDYIFVKLLDQTPILSPMEKIRTRFPNAIHLERPFDQLLQQSNQKIRIRKKDQTDHELFEAFYKEVRGVPCPPNIKHIFNELIEDMHTKERNL